MLKLVGFICAAALLATQLNSPPFQKYKSVETYEVRPGVLMMPSYASDGQVCQIELERRHYSNEIALLDSKLPHEEVIKILNELVPPSERGPQTTKFGREYISAYAGNSVTTFADFRDVSINIYGEASPARDVVAVVKWKNRTCR